MATIQIDPRNLILNTFQEQMSRPLEDNEWDKTFRELGMDSLDVVEFVMMIERARNITISDASAEEEDTPNKLLVYLQNLNSSVTDAR